jgi:hypothetical protein
VLRSIEEICCQMAKIGDLCAASVPYHIRGFGEVERRIVQNKKAV